MQQTATWSSTCRSSSCFAWARALRDLVATHEVKLKRIVQDVFILCIIVWILATIVLGVAEHRKDQWAQTKDDWTPAMCHLRQRQWVNQTHMDQRVELTWHFADSLGRNWTVKELVANHTSGDHLLPYQQICYYQAKNPHDWIWVWDGEQQWQAAVAWFNTVDKAQSWATSICLILGAVWGSFYTRCFHRFCGRRQQYVQLPPTDSNNNENDDDDETPRMKQLPSEYGSVPMPDPQHQHQEDYGDEEDTNTLETELHTLTKPSSASSSDDDKHIGSNISRSSLSEPRIHSVAVL